MSKIRQSDYNNPFQCIISFPRGNLVFLNTYLTLFWYFILFFAPKSHSEVMSNLKMTYFFPLSPYKGKWLKNVIFHDFFKLLLDDLRWCFRYVEMFLGPLEGVSMPRTHFWPMIWGENYIFDCESHTDPKCILGLKTPFRGPKNISTHLKHHLRTSRSKFSLKKSWKITVFNHFSL